MSAHNEESCLVCVDTGTTNTRVWVTEGEYVLARVTAQVGVRDTARDGSSRRLRTALRDVIGEVCARASSVRPLCVVAAGMITSSLGLAEVPHTPAPAGLNELAAAVLMQHFPEVSDLPFLLIPGVRTGTLDADTESINEVDLMRGEETLCLGLFEQNSLAANSTLLNLGSHWKAIKLDERGRIASSVTRLTGELLHDAQTNTILASAVSQERPSEISEAWLAAGMREYGRSGLSRALFCVRLLEQAGRGTPDERYAYLAGAFIAADLDSLLAAGTITPASPVVVTGGAGVAAGWLYALAEKSIPAVRLSIEEGEQALLKGLRSIARVFITTHKLDG
ncbi:MAG: 2-dehydro-3-deoxygalactonokinase [Acidobacteriota bacterium]|nr:2-dehydro-3-deoxygalactonokinase [Acidobacteriota bacterium]